MSFARAQYPLSRLVRLALYPQPHTQPDADSVQIHLFKQGAVDLYDPSPSTWPQDATAPAGSATVSQALTAKSIARSLQLGGAATPPFKPFERLLLTTPEQLAAEVIPYGVHPTSHILYLDQRIPWDVAVGSVVQRLAWTFDVPADAVVREARNVRVLWTWTVDSFPHQHEEHIDFVLQPFVFSLGETDLEQLDHNFGQRAAGRDRWRTLVPGAVGDIWRRVKTLLGVYPDTIVEREDLKRAVGFEVLSAFYGRHTEQGKALAKARDESLDAVAHAFHDRNRNRVQDEGETHGNWFEVG